MANKSKGFLLVSATRASGAPYWIVRGTVGGRQQRREFSDRSEALRYQEQQNSIAQGVEAAHAAVTTRLAPDQVHDAEVVLAQLAREFPDISLHAVMEHYRATAPVLPPVEAARFAEAFKRLQQKYPDATLGDVCDFFLSSFRPPKQSVTLEIALQNYLADVLRRRKGNTLSEWQYKSIGFAMQRLERYFGPKTPLTALTTSRLQEFLTETSVGKDGSKNYSNKTWSNRRGYLTSLFGFCQSEGWTEANPAQGIRNYKKKDFARPAPQTITASTARKLMEYVEQIDGGRMVPYFVLTLFVGIRPSWIDGEITRITPAHINLKRAELIMPSQDAKTKKPRHVRLSPNVIKWLKAYPLEKHPVMFPNYRKLLPEVRRKYKIGHDVLRHTYDLMQHARSI